MSLCKILSAMDRCMVETIVSAPTLMVPRPIDDGGIVRGGRVKLDTAIRFAK